MKPSIKHRSELSRDKILKKLRSAQNINNGLISDRGQSVRIFPQPEDLLATFCEELRKIKGTAIVVEGKDDLKDNFQKLCKENGWGELFCRDEEIKNWFGDDFHLNDKHDDFFNMTVGLTQCEFLVARTGSVLVSSAHSSGRLMNVFPPVHIIVAKASQLVPFLEEAIDGMKERYVNAMPSQITVITGASRTADIEKTLVMGAHGPKQLFVLIDRNN